MDDLSALTRWLAAGGAQHDDLAVRSVAGRRGVFARRAIGAGAVVARVPRPLMITRHTARGSSIGRQIRDAGVELASQHSILAAWLLVERTDPSSPCQPYLDVLPRDLAGFAIHATAAERGLLTGSLAGDLLDELRADLAEDYDRLQARVRRFRPIGRDAFTWARLCVASRAFAVTIDGIDTTALVPFGDLLNHDRGPHTTWGYDQDAAAFTITAVRDYAAGDEVCDSYGRKPNSQLLVQYGFCLDDHAADEAELRFPERFRVTRDLEDPAGQRVRAWLRGQHAEDAAVRAAVAAAARAALARCPTTVAEDDALLAGAALSATARSFIRARRSEKPVLHAWLDWAEPVAGARRVG